MVRDCKWEREESMSVLEGIWIMKLRISIEVRCDYWSRWSGWDSRWEVSSGTSSRRCICKVQGLQLVLTRLRKKTTGSVLLLNRISMQVTEGERKSDGGGCLFSVLESQQKCWRLGKRGPGGKWFAIWWRNGRCWTKLKTMYLICLANSWKRPHSRELGGLSNANIFSGYRFSNWVPYVNKCIC